MAKKSGSYRCSKCNRTFAMAAHLGRHMATRHGRKAKAARVPKTRANSTLRTAGSSSGMSGLLAAIQASRGELEAQQAQITAQMAALDNTIATLGGATAPTAQAGRMRVRTAGTKRGRAGRGAREGSLRSYIDKVLHEAGKPMRVAEITAAVRKAGFKTKNKTLDKSVGITLAGIPTAKRVARGVYAAK